MVFPFRILLVFLFYFLPGCTGGSSREGIGVLRIEGPILDSHSYLKKISFLSRNEKVKAVLVRIDSPGGTVGASQEIYFALRKLREKKPVIASLGDVAASGGLYVASSATKIVANPGTLTGSIGVILQFVDMSDLLKWAKIRMEVVKTGEFKDAGSFHRPLKKEEIRYFQGLIDEVLKQFLNHVVEGRGKSELKKVLPAIADGRVFTGEKALQYGLVDELGGEGRAIELAMEMVGLKGEPRLIYPPQEPRWWNFFFGEEESSLPGELSVLYKPLLLLWVPG
jgi:protease-4